MGRLGCRPFFKTDHMANNSSALKRVRQIKTRTDRNQALKTKVKSLRKKTHERSRAVTIAVRSDGAL